MLTRSKYSRILQIAVGFFIATTAIFLLANFVLAADVDLGLEYAAGTGLNNTQDIRITIAKVIRVGLGLLGIIAVALVIYAGFLWMTSGGNPEKIEQAKKILTNAVIGLIIIFASFAIVSFILNALIGATSGGQNGPGGGPGANYGLSALGNGIIQSHYPARGQKEVPRNTSIIITFREVMKADTLCLPLGTAVCNAKDINKNIIKIFKQSECPGDPTSCTSLVEAKVYSTDGKTFVFVPTSYLGSPSEYINYTVYLGSGLLRQSGEKAFPGAGGNYGWSFEVSNKIDLTPPQVQQNVVFPAPDNARDTTAAGVGAQARGTITVNSPRVYSDAAVAVVKDPLTAPWSPATATVDRNCSQSGIFKVNVESNPNIIKLRDSGANLLGQGVISDQTVTFALCNLKLTLSGGDFEQNSLWTVTITPMIAADTITVGNITYTASNTRGGTNFIVGAPNITARNIVGALDSNPDITSNSDGVVVTITARLAGAAGNSINLSSSNASRLAVVAMAGGRDKVDNVTVNGMKDQPMNSAIQINFNEAIMPLTVSGTSKEVEKFIRVVNAGGELVGGAVCQEDFNCKSGDCTSGRCLGNDLKTDGTLCQKDTECVSYKCEGAPKKCVSDVLAGKFSVSNQYSTVEFLSDKECGFNNCGEKIYCLPANSHLRVELMAASLIPCTADVAVGTGCQDKSPFNTCDLTRKFCRDSANKYFPQADKTKATIVDGITDTAFNSLDGNRNDSAYGSLQNVYYNENAPVGVCESGMDKGRFCTKENEADDCGPNIKCFMNGDNYKWSFFISSLLDLTPPKIKTPTVPVKDENNVNLTTAIKIIFDKLMLSSRLTTGSLTVQNGKENIQHYLLNLRSLADQPVGYWVTNQGQTNNGEVISTDVYINHSPFNASATYKAQAGSGLKDIYQNCYLPCAGPACTVTSDKPCCCDGTPAASCP